MEERTRYEIRDVVEADLPAVVAMNELAVPHVNSLDHRQIKRLLDQAAYFRAIVRGEGTGEEVCAFLVGLGPEASYESPNFLWFCKKFNRFAYIDRIVVALTARRNGLASVLYEDFERVFRHKVPILACEVNIRPPNPASMKFHRGRGFRQFGSQRIDNGDKEVAMLVKKLDR
ncbi:MAG: GNAT family N-acetyltransferase [Woeseia sp.]